jgi:hypothetical protein
MESNSSSIFFASDSFFLAVALFFAFSFSGWASAFISSLAISARVLFVSSALSWGRESSIETAMPTALIRSRIVINEFACLSVER